jgi:uncharacterized membrane protein YdjX (TVP38/TMEM64 family)
MVTFFKLLVTLAIITLCIIFYPYLTPQNISNFISANVATASLFFIAICAVRPILFFLPSMGLTIVAGILFGATWGTIYVTVGGALSTITGFYFAKWIGRDIAKKLIAKNNAIVEFEKKTQKNGGRAVLYMRLINLPWDIVSYWAGISGIRFKDFYISSMIPLIPISFLYTYFGSKVFDPTSTGFIVSLIVMLAMGSIPYIRSRFMEKANA